MKTKSKDKVHIFTIVFLMFIFILTFVITQYNGFYDHRTQDEINNLLLIHLIKGSLMLLNSWKSIATSKMNEVIL